MKTLLEQPLERSYLPVLTKHDFVKRFMAGEFGNKGPNWQSYQEYEASGYHGSVHVRSRVPGGPGQYDVPFDIVWEVMAYNGWNDSTHYLAGMAPTEKTLIQGEVQRTPHGLSLYYSRVPKPMRDSLREGGQSALGLKSYVLLREYLCPTSYDWLWTLLDRYPDHVVEFSTYSTNWGTIPGMNTVFWEVRKY